MRSLVIDTSSFVMYVAIAENHQVLAVYEEEVLKDMASKIIPVLEELFTKVSFSLEDIDKIFIVNGPGSFTGVRVGVTVAKTIAWALKKKIIPISSLEFLATTKVSTRYKIPVIDARRGYVYGGVYDETGNPILSDCYMPFEDLKSYWDEGTIISRDSIPNKQNPKLDVLQLIERHQNDEGVNPHQLNPEYLKLTEAEEKNRKGE